MRRELNGGSAGGANDASKLNPIYYEEKAVKLYGRDHKIGKIVKKKKVNKNHDGEDDEDDEDEEEDEDAYTHRNEDSNNITSRSQNGTFFMSGTYRDTAAANQYRKKHFTKLFTGKHPGLSDQLIKKLNSTS